jgi:hypothetical protein
MMMMTTTMAARDPRVAVAPRDLRVAQVTMTTTMTA